MYYLVLEIDFRLLHIWSMKKRKRVYTSVGAKLRAARAGGFFLEMMTLFRLGLFFKFVPIFAQN